MADIHITNGTILESLNNKADIDGGNYKGSGLQAVLEETTLGTTGGTLTGPLVIHTNGDNQYRNLSLRFSSVDFDTPPSSNIYPSIEFQDEQGRRMGRVEYTYKSDGGHYIGIIDKKNASTATYAAITVGFDANGNPICNFPKCTTKATTTSSASASNVAVITQNYVSGTSWYRVWSDGWIEQGGIAKSKGQHVNTSISLLKAFVNTNYIIVVTQRTESNMTSYINSCSACPNTTKVFYIRTGHGENMDYNWYACGY